MLKNTLIAALGLLIILTATHQEPAKNQTLANQQAGRQVATEPVLVADKTKVEPATKPGALPTASVAQPVVAKSYWAVASSPTSAVSVDQINTALAHFQDMGMSRQGAAYLVGNFMSESNLTPCGTPGDGGLALGLGQWHPGRRIDMPCGYTEQLTWAVNVEMVRDTPDLRNVLFDPVADSYTIMVYLQKWERWGTLGPRWVYAQAIINQI